MKKGILFSLLLLISSLTGVADAADRYNPVAYQDAQVRFTVVTDAVIRMEWSKDGAFTDSPSFLAVNRHYAPVDYKLKESRKWVEITTATMKLRYEKNSGKFTDKNLSVTSSALLATKFLWKPGMKQSENLKGTYRTLDGYDGDTYSYGKDHPKIPLEDGLLAKDGWSLLDDSHNFLFDDSDWPWVKPRSEEDAQDWYFMAYGHNYKRALKDFTVFAGKVPLPPRFAFGYWWSRYWSYSDNELRNLVEKFHSYDIPLDVLVIDMDWHYTEKGKGGWTGYTWNRRLFPDPDEFLRYLKKNDLQITLNLHPANGIQPYEEKYKQMAQWMGMDSTSKKAIPYVGSNKRFMTGWLDKILRPMHEAGVDFWWLDWQQFPTDSVVKGLSNTWWLNYVMFSDMERKGNTRPLLYHRWGGLGNHRYQIGFSGDSFISWKTLDYQPYFNSTASNVLYGYWSHDIGGHQGASSIDPELFTRWMQFGALSPIMRTHTTKNGGLNKEPWVFSSDYLTVLRNTIDQRYQMAPYIYTMARKTYDEGISLCRPMYYDYPESEEAYRFKNEYMFGDNILVAPVTAPMNDGYSTMSIWLPSGNDWYEWHTGTMLKGGQTLQRSFAIDEFPIYFKAGSVIPMYNKVKNLRSNDEEIDVTVIPGQNGSFTLYEDNGNDKAYKDHYATTGLSMKVSGCELTVTIEPRKGTYEEIPARRQFKVNVLASTVPQRVTVNGAKADYQYDGNRLRLTVTVPDTDCSHGNEIQIVYPSQDMFVTDGTAGHFHRIQKSVLALKFKDAGIVLGEELGTMESAGRRMTYYPDQSDSILKTFRANYLNLPQILKAQKLDSRSQTWFLQSIHWE
jgi:alpha-glucosidase (family GH31 glycosyl hydrolase)